MNECHPNEEEKKEKLETFSIKIIFWIKVTTAISPRQYFSPDKNKEEEKKVNYFKM